MLACGESRSSGSFPPDEQGDAEEHKEDEDVEPMRGWIDAATGGLVPPTLVAVVPSAIGVFVDVLL